MSTQASVEPGSDNIRDIVKQKYGEAARIALQGKGTSCCGPASSCGPSDSSKKDVITSDLYSDAEAAALPETDRKSTRLNSSHT